MRCGGRIAPTQNKIKTFLRRKVKTSRSQQLCASRWSASCRHLTDEAKCDYQVGQIRVSKWAKPEYRTQIRSDAPTNPGNGSRAGRSDPPPLPRTALILSVCLYGAHHPAAHRQIEQKSAPLREERHRHACPNERHRPDCSPHLCGKRPKVDVVFRELGCRSENFGISHRESRFNAVHHRLCHAEIAWCIVECERRLAPEKAAALV